MPLFSCSAILFDLDGVLVDSTPVVDRQYRAWAVEQGIDPEAVIRVAHGVRTMEVVARFAPHLDALAETRKIEAREADDSDGVRVIPGAIAFLRSLPRERWGVVTSGMHLLATNRLKRCGLPSPPVLVAADDVQNGKPHPEPYLKGARELGVEPRDCLVFEDSHAGIEAARAAGMRVVGLATTFPADDLSEVLGVVSSFEQVQLRGTANGKLEIEVPG
jgi:mannitol-1-/sugar-/sorbitol-6-phosphatase